MRPIVTVLALAAGALATPAFAALDDEVIATAQARPSAQVLSATASSVAPTATPSRPLTTQEQIAAFIAANPIPEAADAPRGLLPADRDAEGRRKIHGSMGVSVGTGGYRSAYASALIPVGESTTVGVAVSKTDFGKHGGSYGGPVYGDPVYGGYGPGFGRMRGGERQSIALSVMSGGPGGRADTPEGCAPGFRDGGRYIEPLWVERLRDGAHPCTETTPPR